MVMHEMTGDDVPRQALLGLIGGYRSTQMIYAATALGVADQLAGGPQDGETLVRLVGVNADALRRLLRGLVNIGVLAELAGGRFRLTPMGEYLRSDVTGSQQAWAIWEGDSSYRAWGALLESVRTGHTGFETVFGHPFFEEFAVHPQRGAQFNAAIATFTTAIAEAVAERYDFGLYRTVVDVGGGHGTLIAAILRTHPAVHGVLFDLPAVAAGAGEHLQRAGVADRCQLLAGDFFTAVPGSGDCYVLCHIIHDWDDERARRLLRNCRRVLAGGGRLLIVEKFMPAPMVAGAVPVGTDVNMLVLTGGRERSEAEYRALLQAAGFTLERIIPTRSMASIFEARPHAVEGAG